MELLQRLNQGDEGAFEEVFRRNRNVLYFLIFGMVKNTMDAEDLMMESFEKAFENIKSFVPKYKLSTWICTIGKNKALDHLKRKRMKLVDLDIRLRSDYLNPEQEFISYEGIGDVERRINNLNPIYKELINLRSDGFGYKEISERLNVPIGTVCGYLKNARECLK